MTEVGNLWTGNKVGSKNSDSKKKYTQYLSYIC